MTVCCVGAVGRPYVVVDLLVKGSVVVNEIDTSCLPILFALLVLILLVFNEMGRRSARNNYATANLHYVPLVLHF